VWLLLGVAAATTAVGDVLASEPALLPVRNFQPVQLLFPGPRHAGAGVLEAGRWSASLELVESNTLNASRNELTGTAIELDVETTRTSVALRRGLGGGWELGLTLPHVARWGGVLDRPIEAVERLVDRLNPKRELRPRGETVLRYERLGREIFDRRGPEAGLGDVGVALKLSFPGGKPGRRWALRGGVELPTGDESRLLGSGGTDLWIGGVFERPLGPGRFVSNLNLVVPDGRWEEAGLDTGLYATAAVGWAYVWTPRVTVSAQLGYYGSPLEETGTEELELALWDLSAGVSLRLGSGWSWQLGGVQNLVYQSGADFSVVSRWVWTGR
jgi:hypothetical protein